MSLIHGVIAMLLSSGGSVQPAAGSPFTLLTGVLLLVSAIFALSGGILAFNRRRMGGVLLFIAAAICLFAHPDARIYGGIYLVGGVLAFFCRPLEYERDYDEEGDEDEDDNEGEDEEDDDGFAGGQRNEGFGRFPRGGRRGKTEKAFRFERGEKEFTVGKNLGEPMRARSFKVCPKCGASVGSEHNFCHVCGSSLHTAAAGRAKPGVLGEQDDFSLSGGFSDGEEAIREAPIYENSPERARGAAESEEPAGGETSEFPREDENSPRSSAAHKVFVTPESGEHVIPRRPISIGPDNSYQVFSNYTRRRKHRRRPLLRRVVGLLVLCAAAGGIVWFFLDIGGNKKPPEELPVPIPIPEDLRPPEDEDIAFPQNGISGQEALSALRVDPPSRGVVVGSNVNVRPDHSTAGAVVTRLSQGTRVEVFDQWEGVSGTLSGPWYRIRSSGTEGWIYGQYLQPLDARDATLPAGYTPALLKTFGASRTEMADRLGPPTRQTPTTLTWSGLTANLRGDEVTRLQITSAKHVLQNNIAVGITDDMLYKNAGYPSDYRSGRLVYLESGSQGMSVQMQNGKVQSVTVGNL
jgi:hypothetical protein